MVACISVMENLADMPMALGLVPSTKKKSYSHSAWALDPKGSGIQSQPQLHSELRPA